MALSTLGMRQVMGDFERLCAIAPRLRLNRIQATEIDCYVIRPAMDGWLTCDFTMNTHYKYDLQLQLPFNTL